MVLKAKAAQKIGNKIFYAGEPVIYFDTLKTSSLEGASTTVYATGGRGNPQLVSWDGERTMTFTMEDALISPEGFMILSGAGLIEASKDNPIYQHITETINNSKDKITIESDEEADTATMTITLSKKPFLDEDGADKRQKFNSNMCYVMLMRDGEIVSEPYIPKHQTAAEGSDAEGYKIVISKHEIYDEDPANPENYTLLAETGLEGTVFPAFDSVLVDYYTKLEGNAKQIEITADKFGGNYYLEASTLFRDTNGVDMPAEFVIPNCRVQSNFTFSMASTGDPSEEMRLAA